MTQGTREEMMVGNSVYSKFLKMKISLLYPHGADMIDVPCNQYLVHGWLKTPTNWSTFTTPVVNNANRTDLKLYTIQRLKAYFDERDDKLKFIPKANTGFKILGYRKITNDKNSHFSTVTNAVGPKSLSCTLRICRACQESIIPVKVDDVNESVAMTQSLRDSINVWSRERERAAGIFGRLQVRHTILELWTHKTHGAVSSDTQLPHKDTQQPGSPSNTRKWTLGQDPLPEEKRP